MPKFRKKPVVIEAEQYFPSIPTKGVCYCKCFGYEIEHVHTTHNQAVKIEPTDWIIPEPDGNGYYPCKAAIFETTYEPVEEG